MLKTKRTEQALDRAIDDAVWQAIPTTNKSASHHTEYGSIPDDPQMKANMPDSPLGPPGRIAVALAISNPVMQLVRAITNAAALALPDTYS